MRANRLKQLSISLMLVLVTSLWGQAQDTTPVDPNLIQSGKNILSYFGTVYGQNTVTGVWNNQARLGDRIFDCTGVYPAILGEDLCGWNATKFSSDYISNVQKAMNRLKDFWNTRQGIPHVTFHWPNPLTAGGNFADSQEHLTQSQWNNIVTPGTSEYNTMISELNWHLDYLKQLTDLNIPVLWRPLHEIDGGWFWWTNKDNPGQTAQLWRIVYNHITNVRGLHNLIWVWSSTEINPLQYGTAYRQDFYPGDQYADIIGVDLYNWDVNSGTRAYWNGTVSYKDVFDIIQAISPTKMVALCEGQALPNATNQQNNDPNFAKWLYALPWWADNCTSNGVPYYSHAYYISENELPSFTGPVANSLTVSPSTISLGSGAGSGTITVSANISWTASDNAAWLSVSPASGSGNGSVTVTATTNTGAARSGTVTVSGSGITRTVTVNQAAPGTTPPSGTIEAEDWTSQSGGSNSTAQSGYTGTGYFDFGGNGSFAEWNNVSVASSGNYDITFRYANGGTTNRSAALTVNGVARGTNNFATNGSWSNWQTVTFTNIPLNAGSSNTVRLAANSSNGGPNLDNLSIAASSTTPPPAAITIQAENSTANSGGNADNVQAGFTGTGYFDMGGNGSWMEYTFNATAGGTYGLSIRYANGSAGNRACNVITNGSSAASSFAATGSWTTWTESTSNVTLSSGSNTIRITATTSSGGPNVDRLVLTPAGGGGARISVLALAEVAAEGSLMAFPNPVDNEMTLQGIKPPMDVTISNLIGEQIKFVRSSDGKVDVSDLAKGLYLIRVKSQVIRIIKQ